ncbi:MAG: hypothetical protein ACJARD_000006 [Alphaproteobacteria bacterium]|jgi:hypothetical protein
MHFVKKWKQDVKKLFSEANRKKGIIIPEISFEVL